MRFVMIDLTWEFLESWRVAKDDGKVRTSQITPVEPRKTCIFLYNKLSFYKYKVSRSIQKCQNIPAGTRYLQIGNKKCPDERPDKVPDWHKITGVVRARLALSAFHNSPDIFQPQPENARPGQSPFSLGHQTLNKSECWEKKKLTYRRRLFRANAYR